MHRIEFTIEPFVEGMPGRHVLAPVEAAAAFGVSVEFGPFGSGCESTPDQTPGLLAAIVEAALSNGATHINIDVSVATDQGAA